MNILCIFVLLIIVYIVFTQHCILTSYQNIFIFDKISTFFYENTLRLTIREQDSFLQLPKTYSFEGVKFNINALTFTINLSHSVKLFLP